MQSFRAIYFYIQESKSEFLKRLHVAEKAHYLLRHIKLPVFTLLHQLIFGSHMHLNIFPLGNMLRLLKQPSTKVVRLV